MSSETQTKVDLNDEQKAAQELIKILNSRVRAKKVRIPPRVEDISLRWVREAPFFSEFLLRFNYFLTEAVPTMGVNSRRGRINLYINEKFMNGGMEHIKFDDKGEAIIKKDDKGDPIFDENGNVEYETEEWPGLSDEELEGVLVHEIMHLIRLHHERALEDHYVFNIAGDMLINEDIKEMTIGRRKIHLPKGAVYLKMAHDDGYTGEPITEPLYNWLLEKREQYENQMSDLMQNGNGQGQCDNCNGSGKEKSECESCGGDGQEKDENGNSTGNSCPDCGCSGEKDQKCSKCGGSGKQKQGNGGFDARYGSKIDEHEIMGDNDGLTESTIREIIDTGKIRGWGNISGNMVSKLEELTKPAQIKWQQLLRKYLSAMIYNHGPWHENTWSRRNRRQLPLPGTKKLSNKIVVAVDTSGSIRQADLEAFFTEIEAIVKDQSQLIVIQCDTQIVDVKTEYKKGDFRKIDIKGRGGTIVQPVFDYMLEHKLTQFPVVYFTDGYFSYDFETHGIRTIWCVTEDCNDIPGGKNVYIDVENT